MKGFYSLALFAVIAVTATFAKTILPSMLPSCVPVPDCPFQNPLDSTVHVAYKDDCHKFYKCNAKCGYLMECPLIEGSVERLVFNQELQVCDWPSNVPEGTCANNPISKCDLNTKCPAQGTAKLAHDKDCHNYYLCNNGNKLPLRCDNGIFDPVTQTCDESGNAKCYITGGCDN